MTKTELITVGAIVIGPIVAVIITLWFQSRSERRARQYHVLNTIWDTHHDASNPSYSSAIRSIPVVFHHDKKVREVWKNYMANVQSAPTESNKLLHNQQFLDRKHDLISAIADAVGLDLSEREIRESVYQANANVVALERLQKAQQALPRIAEALEKQAKN